MRHAASSHRRLGHSSRLHDLREGLRRSKTFRQAQRDARSTVVRHFEIALAENDAILGVWSAEGQAF
jgi:hypothetical protein